MTQTVTEDAVTNGIQHETRQINSVTQSSRMSNASRTEVEVEVDIDQVPKNLVLFADAPSVAGKAKKSAGEQAEVIKDREAWLAKARALTGLTPEETPGSKGFAIRFAVVRKQRGIEQLLRALDGLEGDTWASQQSLLSLLSDTLIEKGLARKSKATPTRLDLSKMDYSTWDDL